MKHQAVCVFASPRSGSNLICEQLAAAMRPLTDKPVVNLYEYLSPHNYVDLDGHSIIVDFHGRMPRPTDTGIDVCRLRSLSSMDDRIPVFKVLPRDICRFNLDLIESTIFNRRSTFKICLNRWDIANQILSYFISEATGLWHSNQGGERQLSIIEVSYHRMEQLGNEITAHYLWHAENRHRYDMVVWYHDLERMTYPMLLGHDDPLPVSQTKINTDHHEKARSCIINANKLIAFAKDIEHELSKLREYLS